MGRDRPNKHWRSSVLQADKLRTVADSVFVLKVIVIQTAASVLS